MGLISHTKLVWSNLWNARAHSNVLSRVVWTSAMFVREAVKKALGAVGLADPLYSAFTKFKSHAIARPLKFCVRAARFGVALARHGVHWLVALPRRIAHACARPVYRFIAKHFFTLMYPVNFVLSIVWRRRKYDNSVLHVSYMVHIPWYATRILRKQGMKADYLAVGGESPWWKKFDYHFPKRWPPLFFQEWWFFWKVMAKYEVIHAHFGIQLSQTGWEIPHLKRLGRKIVVHYRGCEVRDPLWLQETYPDNNICSFCDYNGTVCEQGKPRVERANAAGDAFLVTTPDMQDFEKDAIHFPFFTPEIEYRKFHKEKSEYAGDRPLKIVHATNHPGIEGTARIQQAVDRLLERGYQIDFTFMRGKTPDELLHAMGGADLTIGKMKMGYYANTQIESMFLGVPSITYVRPDFMNDDLRKSGLIFSDLDHLEQTIAYYADNPDELAKKRAIARSSILELHDNDRLAARLRRIYRETLGETVTDEQEAEWANRPLRVLHIGNIANNAYYNGRILRREGVHADVLCYDNYWVMSSPEWEEAEFTGVPEDQGLPDWSQVGLRGYKHPRWFAQGERTLAIRYLIAQQSQTKEADRLFRELAHQRATLARPVARKFQRVLELPGKVWRRAFRWTQRFDAVLNNYETGAEFHLQESFLARCHELVDEFQERFPEREDRMEVEDLTPYLDHMELFQELFSYYDVIHGYATDPVYPMLANFSPYVGFEHGTLRDAPEWDWEFKGPFYGNAIGRITALGYAKASHTFITNADCKVSAERLRLASYSGMPHPSADDVVFKFDPKAREEIHRQLGVSRVYLCPIRHDWVEKGTDRYIRAIPAIREQIGDDFVVCFTPWGREIERSKELIRELGVEKYTRWVGPFGAVELVRWLSAADVVFDQLTYESFSGMTPRAIACGTPIIACYSSDVAAWMWDPAPVLVATQVEEIVNHVVQVAQPGFLEEYRPRARAWTETWHSSRVICDHLMRVYARILDPTSAPTQLPASSATSPQPPALRRAD